MSETIYKYKNV